jgi:hypothetical protein
VIPVSSSILEAGKSAQLDEMESTGVGGIIGNKLRIVLEIFDAVGDRVDLGNRPDICVGDCSIEGFCQIGTVKIEEAEGNEAKHERNTRDTRGAPPWLDRSRSLAKKRHWKPDLAICLILWPGLLYSGWDSRVKR